MDCFICNQNIEDGMAKIVGGHVVHEECYNRVQEEERVKEETKIVEAEYTEVTEGESEAPEQPQPKCEIVVGMEPNGNLYFFARGAEPSLLNIEGLLKFAQLKMRKIWDERMSPKAPDEPPRFG
jgi:hypothetical protein